MSAARLRKKAYKKHLLSLGIDPKTRMRGHWFRAPKDFKELVGWQVEEDWALQRRATEINGWFKEVYAPGLDETVNYNPIQDLIFPSAQV